MTNIRKQRRWLKKHTSDPYVKLAQREGFRSRAAYKLLALHEKEHLFFQGQTVLDLGAAPGAWSQLAVQQVGEQGKVFAVDRLPMNPLNHVTYLQGDLEEEETLEKLYTLLPEKGVDFVMSDMAPNLSGIASIDQPRTLYLIELALDIAEKTLKKKGHFLVKCFHGIGFDQYFKKLRTRFEKVSAKKPAASRSNSSEVYLLAKTYRGL
jgi:23S rRNA (uridine2552-2'-O)-methyltransferase